MTTTTAPKLRKTTHLDVPTLSGMTRIVHAHKAYSLVETHWLGDAVGQPVEHSAGTIVLKVLSGSFMQGTGVVHDEIVILPADDTSVSASRDMLAARIATGQYAR